MRVDMLPDNDLVMRLQRLIRFRDEIKNKQFQGSDGVLTYRIFSPDTWDYTDNVAAFATETFTLTFTPNNTLFASGAVYRMEYAMTDSSGGGSVIVDKVIRKKVAANGVQQWTFTISNGSGSPVTASFKFYFFTTGSGTFSAA